MNGTLKRAAVACLLMFGLLMVNVTYLGAVKAEDYRGDSRNQRSFFARYSVDRGWITADDGNTTLAKTVDTGGDYRFERQYPDGKMYAHVLGFFAPESSRGVELSAGKYLDGSHPDLLVRRAIEFISNEPPKGASVDLTIVPRAQKVAYDALRASGKRGAVVAMNPKTGAVQVMVSVPTYDPNVLVEPNKAKVATAFNKMVADEQDPLLNRAVDKTYPPGSTFKVVTAAAFLEDDPSRTPETQVDAPQVLDLPQTTVGLPNYGGAACGGGQVSLRYALERSCNTPFAKFGMELGWDKMREQAAKFGAGEPLPFTLPVAKSDIGPEEELAALAQLSIGQRNNQMTPLQMLLVAAGIANGGEVMTPYLVHKIVDPDDGVMDETQPKPMSEAVSAETAAKLKDMMVSVVQAGTGTGAQIPNVSVAGKTGTAEAGDAPAPHAWFIGFAPADDPEVAICVFIEAGSAGTGATGGGTAAPLARDVMQAVLQAK
ncbi:penicillin-binding protein A [Acrocarpospora phusangensis]|uniref:Penicillin-binding protein A n=1 Tax=Acrocarpospora phusangensis TaxID=1070424 RepID=A0A919Q9S8_9ACTN|nr:penicillin-binding protein 2 [Acrocarpospora phusangensis]GIH23355.1 penicillin-binding protein A [Acrocarpospora phusangensis]